MKLKDTPLTNLGLVMFWAAIILYFIMPKLYFNPYYNISIGLIAITLYILTGKNSIIGAIFIFIVSIICFVSMPLILNSEKPFPFHIPNEFPIFFYGMIFNIFIYGISILIIKEIYKKSDHKKII